MINTITFFRIMYEKAILKHGIFVKEGLLDTKKINSNKKAENRKSWVWGPNFRFWFFIFLHEKQPFPNEQVLQIYRVIIIFLEKVNANNVFDNQSFWMQSFANLPESLEVFFVAWFTIIHPICFVLFKDNRGPVFFYIWISVSELQGNIEDVTKAIFFKFLMNYLQVTHL